MHTYKQTHFPTEYTGDAAAYWARDINFKLKTLKSPEPHYDRSLLLEKGVRSHTPQNNTVQREIFEAPKFSQTARQLRKTHNELHTVKPPIKDTLKRGQTSQQRTSRKYSCIIYS